jgi:predicted RNA binding protein YcfA (HicA-like mRNA interferase family)
MSEWPAAKARRVLAALLRVGWTIKREASSHKVLTRDAWPDTVFAFHDSEESGRGCWRASRSKPVSVPRTCERHTRRGLTWRCS